MRKLLFLLFLMAAFSVSAQNEATVNPASNEDGNTQLALNTNKLGNLSDNNGIDIQAQYNPGPPQVQVQVQQATGNRGNFFNTGNSNPGNNPKTPKVGQSIQPISSGGGGSYSGSSGKSSVKSHTKKSLQFVLKKTFKKKYKHPKHYANKKRVKKCHAF